MTPDNVAGEVAVALDEKWISYLSSVFTDGADITAMQMQHDPYVAAPKTAKFKVPKIDHTQHWKKWNRKYHYIYH